MSTTDSTELPAEVLRLVEKFHLHRDAYRTGPYNETQVRREFIDPLFTALGWDVDNRRGYAEAYKDVIHEDAIKIGGETKAPDYCFRIGGTRKFFLEAKKPSINVKDDPGPAYQLRRYAWSAKLPLSILTDFEEFAVYDTRIQPDQTHKAGNARVLYLKYTEYVDRWSEIASIFSRDAVLKGSFDKFAESNKQKRGTAEVDDAFLAEIESWRDLLAKNLALRNPALKVRELNYAVQVTIDRIVFLRMCEDRGIETYGQLRDLTSGNGVYPRLLGLFDKADEKYNSGLFHFLQEKRRAEPPDMLTPSLVLDDYPIKSIIKNLYYPDSPYEFSVLPAEILGQVYEQFLGKVIRLTAGHRAVIEEKPEVKKAGGVFYTPAYIVDNIVEKTVGALLRGKTPEQAKIKILDPACGSGSFLIGAYRFLLDWHRDWYVNDGPAKHTKELYQGPGGLWRLTTPEKKRILLTSIYGVDIDTQAVEVTKLSLLLKVLEGESEASLTTQLRIYRQRALPDLSDNIKCGNSLIASDYYHDQQTNFLDAEVHRVNAFDWEANFPFLGKERFDAVIGNPPYDVMEKTRGAASGPHTALSEYVKIHPDYQSALGGKLNLFRFFIVRSLSLVRRNGRYGMIVPLSLLADVSCARTRRYLLREAKDVLADCFPQKDNPLQRVFLRAKLSTFVVTGTKAALVPEARAKLRVRVYPRNRFDDPHTDCTVKLADTAVIDPKHNPIPLADQRHWDLCLKVHRARNVVRLGQVDDYQVTRGEINQKVYEDFITEDPAHSRMLKGVEVGRFHQHTRLSQGHREWFDESKYHAGNTPKPIRLQRRIATQRITGVDERLRIVATVIDPPCCFADSTNSITVRPGSPYHLEYLLGLFNSALYQWRFKLTSTNNNVGTNELDSMPFRTINFNDPVDLGRYNRMLELVQRATGLHQEIEASRTGHDQTIIKRQLDTSDDQIDQLVSELFGLDRDDTITVAEKLR